MFAGIDHRFLVATLKIRLKSRNMVQSNRLRLDVRRLRDESVAQEYKWKFVESSDEFNDSDDIEKLQTDFKIQNLKVSLSCLRGIHRTSRSFLIWDFLEHL